MSDGDRTVVWFDNHCHLTSLDRDPAEVVAEAAEDGVAHLLTVGCDVADSRRAIEIAADFANVWATAGVHPHEAKDGIEGLEELIIESAEADRPVVAVGECGLDYHYDHSPRAEQRVVFERQIEMAHRHDLALVIHTREAWADTFEVLDACGTPDRTVFHCFTGGPDDAEQALARGAYLSFSGIVTFPSAEDLRAAARITPGDRVLIETDSPYLAPVPHRGQRNRPALAAVVGGAIAELHGVEPAAMAAATWANGQQLYRL